VTHSVNNTTGVAARWYEFRAQGLGTTRLSLYQSGQTPDDGEYRWMGSVAMDQAGDIAIGYSRSSAASGDFPSIYYAGQTAGDPLGTTETEALIKQGTGSQPDTGDRWGDYSSMALDSADSCTFWYTTEYFERPDYPQLQADAIIQAHRDGARGLKILKTLGLYLREHTTTGPLVKVDDPRFDSMWETCGSLGIPVAIHVSDPIAFFTPTDRFNERYEELSNHPDWSFARPGYPSNAELLQARNRVFARHPKTQFVALHVGNFAENLENVSGNLDRFRI